MSRVAAFGWGIIVGGWIMFSISWYFWKAFYHTKASLPAPQKDKV
jgi:hypothetical protein